MSEGSAQPSAAPSAPPALSYLLAGLVMILPAVTALGLGWLGFGFLSWLAALVVGIALGVVWFKVDRAVANLIATFFASFIAPIPVAAFLVTGLRVVTGQFDVMTLEEARDADSGMIAIEGAVVEADLVGEDLSEANPGQMETNHFAAPVVGKGWSIETPVEVWLRCAGERDDPRASCEDAWARQPIVGKVDRTAPKDTPSVSDAIEKHDLKAPKKIVILRTSASPHIDAWATVGGVGTALLLLNLLVFSLLLWRSKAAARG